MTGCSTSGQRSRVHTTRHSSCATCTGRCVAEHRSAIGRDRRADPRVHHVSERPRLLILVTLAEAGGAQTFVAALAEGLKERYHIDVAAHGPEGALADACARLGLPFHHIPSLRRAPHPWRAFRAGPQVRRLVERVRPASLQVNSSKAGFVARIALRRRSVRIVYVVHGRASRRRSVPRSASATGSRCSASVATSMPSSSPPMRSCCRATRRACPTRSSRRWPPLYPSWPRT